MSWKLSGAPSKAKPRNSKPRRSRDMRGWWISPPQSRAGPTGLGSIAPDKIARLVDPLRRAAPAGQVACLFRLGELERGRQRGREIGLDVLRFDAATQKIRPDEF